MGQRNIGQLDWMDNAIASLINTFGDMDIGTLQPYDWFMFHPLYAKEWIEKIMLLIKLAENQQIHPKELADYFPTKSCIRLQLYFLLLDLKCAKIHTSQRIKIANFFWDMIKASYKKDIYATESNIIRTEEDIKRLIKEIAPVKASPSIAKLLGQVYNGVYNYVCGLYTDNYIDYPLETEGPYDVSEIYGTNTILVIKKALGLKPVEIWPETGKLTVNDITIYSVYKDVKFKTDAISIHTVYSGDTINNLIYFAVKVNGQINNSAEMLIKLKDELEQASKETWLKLVNQDFENKKLAGLKIRNYGMKSLFERFGIGWFPDKEMINAIEWKPFVTKDYWKIPKASEEQNKYWRRILHPADEFYPGIP